MITASPRIDPTTATGTLEPVVAVADAVESDADYLGISVACSGISERKSQRGKGKKIGCMRFEEKCTYYSHTCILRL